VNRLAFLVAVSTSVSAACSRPAVVRTATCAPQWTAAWIPDSTVMLCLPPGFVARSAYSWSRPAPPRGISRSIVVNAPAADFLSVELLRWPADSLKVSSWPPRLGSGPECRADCSTVDSVVVHGDTVAGHAARTETGLVSGGFAGLVRQPTLVSGWGVSDARRVSVQGWSAWPATLDTLRMAIATVQVTERR
jgi:hypothetical protein